MSTWQDVDRILQTAFDLPPDELDGFLDAECGDDEALRSEVLSLLAWDRERTTAIDGAAQDRLSSPTGSEVTDRFVGMQLGPYRVGERIGAGGMASVYEAERDDERYQRRVAIKFLRSRVLSRQGLMRFRTESHVLARLDHPGIARLHDAGATPDGIPYLVMEWIAGQTLDQYLSEQRPTLEERLDLIVQLTEAVGYAHRHLVIHRDIKPGNVLVTPDGQVKLLDFGIAKVLDADLAPFDATVTETQSQQPFTPRWASPEQLRGAASTTASDVYALGILLFFTLTGRSPYPKDTRSPVELALWLERNGPLPQASQAADGEPLGLGADETKRWRKQLRGDVDAVIRRAISPEPDDRYGSGPELLHDLRALQTGDPVRARPPGRLERIARRLTRDRRTARGLGLFAVLLAATVGFGIWSFSQQRAAERLAEIEVRAGDDTREFIYQLFSSVDPAVTQGGVVTAKDLLQSAVARLAELPEDHNRTALAAIYAKAASGLNEFGIARQALNLVFESEPVRPDFEAPYRALALMLRADVAYNERDFDTALEFSQRALAAADDLPEEDAFKLPLRTARVGNALMMQGRYAEALDVMQKSTEASRGEPRLRPQVGFSLISISTLLRMQGDFEGSLSAAREGIEILRAEKETVTTLSQERYLSIALSHLGHDEEARSVLSRALLKLEEHVSEAHGSVIGTRTEEVSLARLYGEDPEEIAEMLREVDRLYEELNYPRSRRSQRFLYLLGLNQADLDMLDAAIGTLQQLVGAQQERRDPASVYFENGDYALGRVLARSGRHPEALPHLRSAVSWFEENAPFARRDFLTALFELDRLEPQDVPVEQLRPFANEHQLEADVATWLAERRAAAGMSSELDQQAAAL